MISFITLDDHEKLKKRLKLVCNDGTDSSTPYEIFEYGINKIKEDIFKNPNTKFLDPCCGIGTSLILLYWKLIKYHTHDHIINNMLYCADINAYYCEVIKRKIGIRNVYKEDTLNKNWNNMKFDGIILNPPYSRGLHLKFLSLAYDLLKDDGQLICIHPSDWLVLQRDNKIKYDDLKSKLGHTVNSIDFLNGNKVFKDAKAGFFIPLEIIHIDKSKNTPNILFTYKDKNINSVVNSLDDVNLIGPYDMIKSIRNKIISKSLPTTRDFSDKDFDYDEKYYVCPNWMAGSGTFESTYNDGKTRIFPRVNGLINPINNFVVREPMRSKAMKKDKEGNLKTIFVFDSEKKAQNLLNFFTKSILHKFIMLTYCNNQHVQVTHDYTPWLDWNIKWTDDKINAFFDFTEEEYSFMVSVVDRYALSVTC